MRSLNDLYQTGRKIITADIDLKWPEIDRLLDGYREDLTFIDEEEALLYLIHNVYKIGVATGYQERLRQEKKSEASDQE